MDELLASFLRSVEEGEKQNVLNLLHQNVKFLPFLFDYSKRKQQSLVHKVCCHDYPDVLHLLAENGADLNETNAEGLTPLQVACKHGCPSVVSYLLRSDHCDLESFLPNDLTSPHYLATVCGHFDVVTELINFAAVDCDGVDAMLADSQVRSTLFYAACLSGQLEMVKFWYRPIVDLNAPVQFVADLTNCENLTPLQAACDARSLDIIQFLLEKGAKIKPAIVDNYPDIMAEVLQDWIHSDKVVYRKAGQDDGQRAYVTEAVDLQRKQLYKLHPSWFERYLHSLTSVDVSHNSLEALPSCLPWQMPTLECLNASSNKLRSFPVAPKDCDMDKLGIAEIYLSNNKLEDIPQEVFRLPSLKRLDVHQNRIHYLYRTLNREYELMSPAERHEHFKAQQSGASSPQISRNWNCPNLTFLNVSNNHLELLSDDLLKACTGLRKLIANNNNLHKFPMPWACELTYLDLCHNGLCTLPTNVSQFWSTSLRTLLLSHNSLIELPESIVTLNLLEVLDLSHNAVSHLASPSVWSCDCLQELDLGFNCLTNRSEDSTSSPKTPKTPLSFLRKSQVPQESTAFFSESSPVLEFPDMLKDHLCYLSLNNNNLFSIPTSVFQLTRLKLLDLKNNPNLTSVPHELAKLQACDMIDLEGCPIPPAVIPPKLITDAATQADGLLAFLRLKLRECEQCNRVKLMVIGKEKRGKTSLINALIGNQSSPAKGQNQIVIRDWKVGHSSFWRRARGAPEVNVSVWDMPGSPLLADIHQCFLTENTLYLLVWDAQDGLEGVRELDKWFGNIQSRAPSSTVLVVGTHLDQLPEAPAQLAQHIDEFSTAIRELYGRRRSPRLGPVRFACCLPGDLVGISDVQEAVYNTAIGLKHQDSRGFSTENLIGRQMPKSYICLQQQLQNEAKRRRDMREPPVLVQGEFDEILQEIPNNDLDTAEEMKLAVKFLHELGDLLHFNDQLRGLNSLYFLDPVWLCDLLSQVIVNKKCQQFIRNGIIRTEDLKFLFNEEKFPHIHIDKYIQLLERFEITMMLDEKKLLIPCKVSQEKFGSVVLSRSLGEKVYRFYRMSFVPSGFMSRLIAKILVSIPRFTGPSWRVSTPSGMERQSSLSSRSFKQSFCMRSGRGFQMKRVEPIYWQEGIKVSHDGGQFVVECVRWNSQQPDEDSQSRMGILVTVLSTIGDFSALGFIVDEIDNLIEDWYKGLDEGFQYALCPACCGDLADHSQFLPEVNHFSVLACAGMCRTNDSITCPVSHTKIPLKTLVPELVLADLPNKLLIDSKDLEVTIGKDSILGEGSFGCVYSGIYHGDTVAVKIFPISLSELLNCPTDSEATPGETPVTWRGENCPKPDGGEALTNDSGSGSVLSSLGSSSHASDQSYVSHGSFSSDTIESKGLKVMFSLSELRKEVALLSKFNHPCVLSLVGVCLLPTCLILEKAPLGNLREAITQHMNPDLHDNIIAKVKNKVFPSVFSRNLTFKIIFQIIKALRYLHALGVIYRDLKPGNILVWSLDTADTVNIKLSDYGISKFSTPQGLAGFCGTPGYQAPEICYGIAYDEKVDLFAFGIVIFEVLSGVLPYKTEFARNVTQAIREGVRPRIQTKDYTVDTRMPCFESLMVECWDADPMKRPPAGSVLSQMKKSSFLCLRKDVKGLACPAHGNLDCIFMYYSEVKSCQLAWLWEGRGRDRKYHIVDTSRGQYVIPGQTSAGPTVTCMTKVNEFMWVGNESSQIEVFGQRGAGVPSCLGKLDTPDVPTCLLYHRVADPEHKFPARTPRPSQDFVEYVYCGLEDGRLFVFSSYDQNPLLRKKDPEEVRWRSLKTLTFTQNKAVTKATLLNKDAELWLACGSAFSVVSVSTLLVEHQISVVLPEAEWSEGSVIVDMVASDNRVWCCCQNSHNILEIDSNKKVPLCVYSCKDVDVYDLISKPITTVPQEEPITNVQDLKKLNNIGKSDISDSESELVSEIHDAALSAKKSGMATNGPSPGDEDTDHNVNPESASSHDEPPPLMPRKPVLPPRFSKVGMPQDSQRTVYSYVHVTPICRHEEQLTDGKPVIPPRLPSRKSKPIVLQGRSRDSRSHLDASLHKSITLPRLVESEEDNDHTILLRQKSKSMTEGLSHFRQTLQKQQTRLNMCLLVVKDTLWIGQDGGIITAVSISPEVEKGKVMFVLDHSDLTSYSCPGDVVTLNQAGGNSVLSTVKRSNGNTGLLLWEAWGSNDVEEVRGYAIQLHQLEQDFSRMSSL